MDPQKRETRRPELARPSRRRFVKGLAIGGVVGGLGLWRDTAWAQGMTRQATGVLSGTEFDAAFVQMMVWSHTEAIEKYGAQTHANPNRALHDFAMNSLPMLREHLATAESLR